MWDMFVGFFIINFITCVFSFLCVFWVLSWGVLVDFCLCLFVGDMLVFCMV